MEIQVSLASPIHNIYTSSAFCDYEHKKNFDIHSSMKLFP